MANFSTKYMMYGHVINAWFYFFFSCFPSFFLAWFSFIDLFIKFSAEKLSFAPSQLYLRLLAECLQHVLFFFFFFLKSAWKCDTCADQKKTIKQRKGILRHCRIYDILIWVTAFIFASLLFQQFRSTNELSYSIHKQEIPNKLDVG